MNILFVCTGNTCRSPMAAAMMDKLATEKELDVRIESAGIFANDGDKASDEAIVVMREYGIDLTDHYAKNVTEELVKKSDLILTMTVSHKKVFENIAKEKTFTICEYAGEKGEISDPFGGNVEDYRKSAEQIYVVLEKICERIEKENK